jgi:capsular polysaccharide biosynthesis protein
MLSHDATTTMEMEHAPTHYARALRRHWLLIVVVTLVCTGAAAALAWTAKPRYESDIQFFVAAALSDNASDTYQGGLFTQQRVASYVQVVASPPVLDAVTREIGEPDAASQLRSEISAGVPTGTVLINVSVTDRSARRAKAVADALGRQFPGFVAKLESADPRRPSPVKVSVTSPAALPTSPVSPHKPLYVTVGALLGLLLGAGVALLRGDVEARRAAEAEPAVVAESAPPVAGAATGGRN